MKNKIATIGFLIILTLSNFAVGNSYTLIKNAVKNNDIEALNSALVGELNARDRLDLRRYWEGFIQEACTTSPDSILPLLKFGYKNNFNEDSLWENNLLVILTKNNNETSLFAIKYYKSKIEKINHIQILKELPIEIINLLFLNGLNQELYAKIIDEKISDFMKLEEAPEQHVNEFSSFLEQA